MVLQRLLPSARPSPSDFDALAAVLSALLVAVSVVAGVGLAGGAPTTPTPQPVDSCTTITEPGTYELTTDLETQQGVGDACIRISASGVVFDGGGHTVRGNGSGTGIGVGDCCTEGPDDVVVRDVEVVHFSDGITSFEVDHLRIRNVRVVWSDATGMSGGDGIYLWNGTDIVVEDSTVVNSEMLAVQISGTDVVVRNNWLVSNDGGFNLHGVNHFIAGNLVENSGTVWAYGSGGHTVRNNTVVNATSTGIAVSDDSAVVNNVVRNSGDAGIEVGANGVVTGNRVVGNEKGGILVDEGGNLIYDNYLENDRNVVGPEDEPPVGARWSVDRQPGTNVVGGSTLGGNFWAKPDGSGYSQTCTDADGDGICDDPYSVPGTSDADAYPLADFDESGPSEPSTTAVETTTTTDSTPTESNHSTSTELTTTATPTTATASPNATTSAPTTTESASSGGGASGSKSGGTGGSTGGGSAGSNEDETARTTTETTTATETTATTETTRTTTETTTTATETRVRTETTVGTTTDAPRTMTTSETESNVTSTESEVDTATTTTEDETALLTSATLPGLGLVVAALAVLAGGVLANRRL